MEGKICLVTGGNAGIGYETVKGLLEKGAEVIMVCRSKEKGETALASLKKETGNEKVHLILCDLGSQASIREAAAKFRSKFDRLDVLVNNAGAFFSERRYSPENIELQFAINHMGYFYLTHLLLDLIKKAAPARIVNVSSNANYSGKIYFDNINGDKGDRKYNGLQAYSQSKLANVLFTKELARRVKDDQIIVNCLHPGVVRTHIGNKDSSGFYNFIWKFLKPFMVTPKKGAETSLYLATSPEVEGVSGKYFVKCKPKAPNKLAESREMAKKLWELSEGLIVE